MHLGPQIFLVPFRQFSAVLHAFNDIALPTFTSHGGRKMPHLPQQLKFNALPAPFNASWTGVFDINLPSSLSKVLADHCCRDFAKRTHAHHKSCPNFALVSHSYIFYYSSTFKQPPSITIRPTTSITLTANVHSQHTATLIRLHSFT